MSKLLSALLVTAAAFALAPVTSASGWGWGNNNNNNNNNHCYGGNHNHCKHGGGWKGNNDCKGNNHHKSCKHGGGKNDCGNNTKKLDCDAGGPYTASSAGAFAVVELDGTDSRNETGYLWSTNYPGAMFDDVESGQPTLTIPLNGDCSFELTVRLTVTNSKESKTCSTTVRLRDTEPPKIFCPETAKIVCGQSTSPNDLGCATATDNCDSNVKVTYSDKVTYTSCPADRFDSIIERRWKATDDDCNTSKCTQIIDVVKQSTFLDVRPGVCPNEYDAASCDLLPVAILGLDGFNVGQIQWNTVKLYGRNCDGGPVSPQCFQFKDVAGPIAGGPECACDVVPPDGNLDLVAFFSRNKLNQRLGLDCLPPGTTVSVVVTGRLCNGCKFVAEDCMIVL